MDIYASCEKPYVSPSGLAYACGTCTNCRRTKSMEWAIRGRHELITNPNAIFITFTYHDKHLPRNAKINPENKKDACGTLEPKDMQNFFKKLRKVFPQKIRYIMCGEYGPKTWRPHYHAIIYGLTPEDCFLKVKKKEPNSKWIEINVLQEIWNKGIVDISENYVTDYCIQYVIGYVRKKLNHNNAIKKYKGNHRFPPYMRTSKGIGKEWAEKNVEQWSKTLKIGYNGMQAPVPRYYIRHIIKKEGRTEKYTIKKIKLSGKETLEWGYKTIENPAGKYTKIIREQEIIIKKENIEKWSNKYNLDKDTIKKLQNEYIKKHEYVTAEREQYNNLLAKLDIAETFGTCLNPKISDERRRKAKAKNKYKDNKSLEDEKTKKYLNGIVKRKIREYEKSPYGNRDIIEWNEE